MRLLLVEDDERLARGIMASLEGAGFAVDILTSGEDALRLADQEPYSAIILDLGLPDLDGLEVLSRLRARGARTPIIILTARDMIDDRINGLDRGADDYMAKPFDPRELESRVRALVRRSGAEVQRAQRSAPLAASPRLGSVRADMGPHRNTVHIHSTSVRLFPTGRLTEEMPGSCPSSPSAPGRQPPLNSGGQTPATAALQSLWVSTRTAVRGLAVQAGSHDWRL